MHRSVKQGGAAHKPQWSKRSKKHTLKQPMKQPMKQAIKQLAHVNWPIQSRNTQHRINTRKQVALHVYNNPIWYSTHCISVLTTNIITLNCGGIKNCIVKKLA
jgi:hypothetical protein